MRMANRILFGSLVGIFVLLIGVPLLAPAGAAVSIGLVAVVVGFVLAAVFWGTIIKLIRRR